LNLHRSQSVGCARRAVFGVDPLLAAKQTLSAHEGQLRTTEVHSAKNVSFSNFENDQKRNEFGTVRLPDYYACGL
jgi:hypothetical protein